MSQLVSEIQSGVCFDPDAICLMGIYSNELAVFRARRRWTDILESSFSLKIKEDFLLETVSELDCGEFRLMCRFNSPCGRYAFWRLTNAQAPEAQYEIETAHIPDCPSKNIEMVLAPDLQSILDTPLVIRGVSQQAPTEPKKKSIVDSMRDFLRKFY
jgi:hypothetical protein